MNENIDLTKILKDCPKGWKFYSSVYGEVAFVEILSTHLTQRILQEKSWFLSENELRDYPIIFKAQDGTHRVTSAGTHIKGMGECIFFPSKDQRDWSKFTAPWYKKRKFDPKTLKPFDRVLVRDDYDKEWLCAIFSHIKEGHYPYNIVSGCYSYCIPYNNETKHLVGTKDEAPEYYRYWEE